MDVVHAGADFIGVGKFGKGVQKLHVRARGFDGDHVGVQRGHDDVGVQAGVGKTGCRHGRSGGARAGGFPDAAKVLAQLQGQGLARKRVGLVALERVPVREHTELQDTQGHRIGEVTSGLLGPSINQPIAMAYLAANHALPNHEVYAEVRGKRQPMRVSPLPFAPHRYHRG